MKFLTSFLTGGAKRFHHLPWDINSANLSTRKLIHIGAADPYSIQVFVLNYGVCVCVCARKNVSKHNWER